LEEYSQLVAVLTSSVKKLRLTVIATAVVVMLIGLGLLATCAPNF